MKARTLLGLGLVALVPIVILAGRAGEDGAARRAEQERAEQQRIAALTPEQKAAEQRDARTRHARLACRQRLPQALHDPNSFAPVDADAWPVTFSAADRVEVTATFRGKNALGATVQSRAACVVQFAGGLGAVAEIRHLR